MWLNSPGEGSLTASAEFLDEGRRLAVDIAMSAVELDRWQALWGKQLQIRGRVEGLAGRFSASLVDGTLRDWRTEARLVGHNLGYDSHGAAQVALSADVEGEDLASLTGRVEASLANVSLASEFIPAAKLAVTRDGGGRTALQATVVGEDYLIETSLSTAWPLLSVLPTETAVESIAVKYSHHRVRSSSGFTLSFLPESGVRLSPVVLVAGNGELALEGEVELASGRLTGLASWHALDVALLTATVWSPPLTGTATGAVRLGGTLARPDIEAHVEILDLGRAGTGLADHIDLDANLGGGTAEVRLEGALALGAALTMRATMPAEVSLRPFALAANLERLDLTAVVDGLDLAVLGSLLPPEFMLRGRLDANATVRGGTTAPIISVQLFGQAIENHMVRPFDAALAVDMNGDRINGVGRLDWADGQSLSLDVDVPAYRLLAQPEAVGDWLARWTDDDGVLSLAGVGLSPAVVFKGWSAPGTMDLELSVIGSIGTGQLAMDGKVSLAEAGGRTSKANQALFSGRWDVAGGLVDFHGAIEALSVRRLARILSLGSQRGIISGSLRMWGHLSALQSSGELTMTVPAAGAYGLPERLKVDFRHLGGELTARLRSAFSGDGRLTGQLKVRSHMSLLPPSMTLDQSSWSGQWRLTEYDLSLLDPLLPEAVRPLRGKADLALFASGPPGHPRVKLAASITGLEAAGLPSADLGIELSMARKGLEAALSLTGDGWGRLDALVHGPVFRLYPRPDGLAGWLARWQREHQVNLTLAGADLGRLLGYPGAFGQAAGELTLSDPAHGVGQFSLTVQGIPLLAHRLGVKLAGTGQVSQAQLAGTLDVDGAPFATGSVALTDSGERAWYRSPLLASIDAAMEVEVPSEILWADVKNLTGLDGAGKLAVSMGLVGSDGKFLSRLSLVGTDLSLAGVPLGGLTVAATGGEGGGQLSASLTTPAGPALTANIQVATQCLARPLGSECRVRDGALTGTISVDELDGGLIAPLLPLGYLADFTVTGHSTVGGTVEHPEVSARARADVRRLKIPPLGWDLQDVEIVAGMEGPRFLLHPLVIEVDGGTARVSGELNVATGDVQLVVGFLEFPVVNRALLQIVADGEVGLRGTLALPELYGTVTIPRGRVGELPLSDASLHPTELSADVVILEPAKPAADQPLLRFLGELGAGTESAWPSFAGAVNVVIPGRFFVQASGADVELAGNLVVALVRPRVAGEMRTLRGHADVLGRRFKLERAVAEFTDSTELNPRIDILASHSIADKDLSPYGLEAVPESAIFVRAIGTVNEPQITLDSDPPMAEEQIMTLLVLGRATLSGGGGASAGSMLAELLVGPLKRKLQALVPIDTLDIQAGERGFADARLKAGVYLASWLFVSYGYRFGTDAGENANELSLEFRLRPALYLETRYGDAGAGGIDLMYRKRY